jgi:hypothetical protein
MPLSLKKAKVKMQNAKVKVNFYTLPFDFMRRFLFRIAYPAALLALSLCVLTVFTWPVLHVRSGLNGYGRCKFLAMINGTADKPFAYRTLLPTAPSADRPDDIPGLHG